MAEPCPNCARPAAEDAVYCTWCGTKLQNLCPTCTAPNPSDSRFCRLCGSSLRADSSPQPSVPITAPPAEERHRTCPRCRNVNETGAVFCFSCGLPLEEAPLSQMAGPGFRPAGFRIRVAAWLIDSIVIGIPIGIVVFSFFATTNPETSDSEVSPTGNLFSSLMVVAYYTIAVAIWATTIGKRVFGIYILQSDGSKVGFFRALARALAISLSWITLGIGFLMIAFRGDKRALHDLICGTVVVYKR